MTDGQQDIIAPDTDDPGNADQLNFESENKAPPPIPVPSHFALLLEPVMFVYAFYIGAIPLLTDQYVRARLSRDYANVSNETSSEICGQNSSRYENDYVSSEASMWMVYASLALLIPAIASLILLGSYSDRGGRKIAIIVPQVGAAVRCISFLAVIYFDWPLYFIVIAAFVEGLSGGISMVIAAGFSYVADITSRDGRSFRIALLEGCFSLGTVVSQVASGYLIASLGFFYPFLILAAIMLLNITVVAVLLPETIVRDSDVRFLSLGHFLKAFNLYFKDDGTGRRWKLLLSLAIVFFTCSVTLGRIDVQIFYLLDLPLCWSPVLIGYFGALFMLIAAPVAVIMTKLTHSTFGDYGLLLIGSISTLAFQAVVTFSTTTILTFMGKCKYFNGEYLHFIINPSPSCEK